MAATSAPELVTAEIQELEGRVQCAKVALAEAIEKVQVAVVDIRNQVVSIVRSPQFQTGTLVIAGSTVTVGAAGGAFGMAVGTVAGSAVGVLPALFTFGLSIPVGAVMGGAAGLCGGAAAGGSTGALAGAGAFRYRVEIKDALIFIQKTAVEKAELGKANTITLVESTKAKAFQAVDAAKATVDGALVATRTKVEEASAFAKTKSGEAVDFITGTKTGVACAAAAGGGIVGTVGGGAAGAASGAAVGLVPAVFTFGLSIPIGAVVGLCVGAATGGAAGVMGGGSVGYGGFAYRKELSDGATSAWTVACNAVDRVKGTAASAAEQLEAKLGRAAAAAPQSPTPVVGA